MTPAVPAPSELFGRHFVAQHERPELYPVLDIGSLPGLQRCLLLADGTVTSLLEAMTMQTTRTTCRRQEVRLASAAESRWLLTEPLEQVIVRDVIVEGAGTGHLYVRARSLVVPGRLPERFVNVLNRAEASVGADLLRAGVEHRREFLWYERRPPALASRTYRVFVGGRPALLISEDFVG